MIDADLEGKRALITGGASGIGLGTVKKFAECGATVAINDIPDNPRLHDVESELKSAGMRIITAPGDLADAEATRKMVSIAAEKMGGLDYLINNAGTPNTSRPIPPSDLDRQDDAFWNVLLEINLRAPFRCVQAARPYLEASNGAVVNTASISGFGGGGSSSAYSVTKAGLINMTKELARGLGPKIRVNAIAPGMVNSDWQCRFPNFQEQVSKIPLRRAGEPADYADAILFLCAGASYITGHTLLVDGGWSA